MARFVLILIKPLLCLDESFFFHRNFTGASCTCVHRMRPQRCSNEYKVNAPVYSLYTAKPTDAEFLGGIIQRYSAGNDAEIFDSLSFEEKSILISKCVIQRIC